MNIKGILINDINNLSYASIIIYHTLYKLQYQIKIGTTIICKLFKIT